MSTDALLTIVIPVQAQSADLDWLLWQLGVQVDEFAAEIRVVVRHYGMELDIGQICQEHGFVAYEAAAPRSIGQQLRDAYRRIDTPYVWVLEVYDDLDPEAVQHVMRQLRASPALLLLNSATFPTSAAKRFQIATAVQVFDHIGEVAALAGFFATFARAGTLVMRSGVDETDWPQQDVFAPHVYMALRRFRAEPVTVLQPVLLQLRPLPYLPETHWEHCCHIVHLICTAVYDNWQAGSDWRGKLKHIIEGTQIAQVDHWHTFDAILTWLTNNWMYRRPVHGETLLAFKAIYETDSDDRYRLIVNRCAELSAGCEGMFEEDLNLGLPWLRDLQRRFPEIPFEIQPTASVSTNPFGYRLGLPARDSHELTQRELFELAKYARTRACRCMIEVGAELGLSALYLSLAVPNALVMSFMDEHDPELCRAQVMLQAEFRCNWFARGPLGGFSIVPQVDLLLIVGRRREAAEVIEILKWAQPWLQPGATICIRPLFQHEIVDDYAEAVWGRSFSWYAGCQFPWGKDLAMLHLPD